MALGKKTGGRKKGTPNKLNKDVKEMILGALNSVGGEQYLCHQARENPTAFMALVGRTMSVNVNASHSINISISKNAARVG